MPTLERAKQHAIDWFALCAATILALLGLVTMNSFTPGDPFFVRQSIWIGISLVVYFGASFVDWRFLRRGSVAAWAYAALIVPLMLLLILGTAVKGAKSWLSLGSLGIQPIELAKLALIVALAKYFSRRHIEIKNIRHIFVSGVYAAIVFVLVALQPDLGGAIIVGLIWFGMVLVSGISRKHLALVFGVALVAFSVLWMFGLRDYQKERLMTFVHPLADIHGAGYNAYQSTVAVGSGELFGKGIGYGTQSKLRFLPEYQTDFIFAAYAEEWGFVGIAIVFALYGVIFWRIIHSAGRGASNFETLFALGILCYFAAHFILHVGINMGLLPVTGTTIPFMSYGGSHLIVEFLSLGMLAGMNRYSRATHREMLHREMESGYDQ